MLTSVQKPDSVRSVNDSEALGPSDRLRMTSSRESSVLLSSSKVLNSTESKVAMWGFLHVYVHEVPEAERTLTSVKKPDSVRSVTHSGAVWPSGRLSLTSSTAWGNLVTSVRVRAWSGSLYHLP